MTATDLAQRIEPWIPHLHGSEGYIPSPLPGLGFLRHMKPTGLEATVYQPLICLILQGRKQTVAGNQTVSFGPGESLIVSHDLPVVSQVTHCPYLALVLQLDVGTLRSIQQKMGDAWTPNARALPLDVAETDASLLDALARYVALCERPLEAQVIAPLVLREIHFRLLMAPHGGMLRELIRQNSRASHIGRAITRIRREFRSTLAIPDIARDIGMSESAFYRHFKAVTATTPLQYQKSLRLLEARRLITTEGYGVTRAALEVGYASPTQFSREYARKFGVSPSAHAPMVRAVPAQR